MGLIKRVDYILLEINKTAFNKIFEQRPQDRFASKLEKITISQNQLKITVPDNEAWKNKLTQNNQFVRLIHKTWYMDVAIKKIDGLEIHLGTLIDFTKQPTNNILK